MVKKQLYTWNWIGGGYNQTYAFNKTEALMEAKRIWPSGQVDPSSIRVLNDKEAEKYWKLFGTWD
jgi:hypothetical protein